MDSVVKRPLTGASGGRLGGGIRSGITKLTAASLRRMKLHFRNMSDSGQYMVTLTYPREFPMDGAKVKAHLRAMREWFRRREVSAAWFLEFQDRGAPHLHLVTDKPVDKKELSRKWFDVVGSGDEKHLRAGTQQAKLRKAHAIAAYVAKYASKAKQKEVPEGYKNVGRFWGAWGVFRLVQAEVMYGEMVDVAEGGTDSNAVAMNSVVRSAKKLLKSKGYKVKDGGVYSITLWGVGLSTIAALANYYGYNGLLFSA